MCGTGTLGHISGEGVLSPHHPCPLKNGCMTATAWWSIEGHGFYGRLVNDRALLWKKINTEMTQTVSITDITTVMLSS